MAVLSILVFLAVIAGLAALFALIANSLLKSRSPERRAALAALGVGGLVIAPALVALLADAAGLVALVAVFVGGVIITALAFPVALSVTRRKPVPHNETTFD